MKRIRKAIVPILAEFPPLAPKSVIRFDDNGMTALIKNDGALDPIIMILSNKCSLRTVCALAAAEWQDLAEQCDEGRLFIYRWERARAKTRADAWHTYRRKHCQSTQIQNCDLCGLPLTKHSRCPKCGYTYCDCQMLGDHRLCGQPVPKPVLERPARPSRAPGKTPFEDKEMKCSFCGYECPKRQLPGVGKALVCPGCSRWNTMKSKRKKKALIR